MVDTSEDIKEIEAQIQSIIEKNGFSLYLRKLQPLKGRLRMEYRIEREDFFNWAAANTEKKVDYFLTETQEIPWTDIQSCEKISLEINQFMASSYPELDYELEVSSPGIFREMRSLNEWYLLRNFYTKVYFQSFEKSFNYKGYLIGILQGNSNGTLNLDKAIDPKFPDRILLSYEENEDLHKQNLISTQDEKNIDDRNLLRFLFVSLNSDAIYKANLSKIADILDRYKDQLERRFIDFLENDEVDSSKISVEQLDIFLRNTIEKYGSFSKHMLQKILKNIKVHLFSVHEIKKIKMDYLF